MKIVIQRVKEAKVEVDCKIVGKIGFGFVVLVGFTKGDSEIIVDKMINKMINLRIFEDQAGKMNLSLNDVAGSILSISQFTLYADCKKGRRPSFIEALNPKEAKVLYQYFNQGLLEENIHLEKGVFGADMQISLCNDGPVTIVLDSQEIL